MRQIAAGCVIALLIGAGTLSMGGCESDHVAHHEKVSQDMGGDVKKTSTDVYEKPNGGYRVEKDTTKVSD